MTNLQIWPIRYDWTGSNFVRIAPTGGSPIASRLDAGAKVTYGVTHSNLFWMFDEGNTAEFAGRNQGCLVFLFNREPDMRPCIFIEPFSLGWLGTNHWIMFPFFADRGTAVSGPVDRIVSRIETMEHAEHLLFNRP